MSGGPIFPSSAFINDTSGQLFPSFYVAATNTNGAGYDEGWTISASLTTSDPVLVMRFAIPPTVPTGTLKLRCLSLANATSGVAKWTVTDKNVAAGSAPGTATLNSETQVSQTWATADIYVENKVTLTSTPAGNDILVLAVTFNHTSWTLAAAVTTIFSIIWE